jgi:hypothetical protein
MYICTVHCTRFHSMTFHVSFRIHDPCWFKLRHCWKISESLPVCLPHTCKVWVSHGLQSEVKTSRILFCLPCQPPCKINPGNYLVKLAFSRYSVWKFSPLFFSLESFPIPALNWFRTESHCRRDISNLKLILCQIRIRGNIFVVKLEQYCKFVPGWFRALQTLEKCSFKRCWIKNHSKYLDSCRYSRWVRGI